MTDIKQNTRIDIMPRMTSQPRNHAPLLVDMIHGI